MINIKKKKYKSASKEILKERKWRATIDLYKQNPEIMKRVKKKKK